ncbi:MAG: MGH1-like glycoside hydrolase domain-containing protein [Planctomycetota bacterium]|jgi:hypothetical protein
MELISWSRGGARWVDERLAESVSDAGLGALPLEADARYYRARVRFDGDGTLVLDVWSPRPLRLWLDGVSVLDEPLTWRTYQRHVRAAVVLPVAAGPAELRVEVGERPRHPESVDRDCPSRNRERVMAQLARNFPDVLRLTPRLVSDTSAPAAALRFSPSQFHLDGLVMQEVIARPVVQGPPSTKLRDLSERAGELPRIGTDVSPGTLHESTSERDERAGLVRLHVPVGSPHAPVPVARGPAPEKRVEPVIEEVGSTSLTVEGKWGSVTVDMPVYERRGRLAPRREFRKIDWPSAEELIEAAPEPVLEGDWAHFAELYRAAWKMLAKLVRHPRPESGLPGSYLCTAAGFFTHYQFVWDTSFTAMATAYGHRALDPCASLDCLYVHQFDGGYIHREIDTRDALPVVYEPDFSPNPPVMAVAEWQIARLTGDARRIHRVYRALAEHHEWLETNRKLPDGTFWTTGLANGLDNSPSLGDGYPDLTAQMAHHADVLADMATLIGESHESSRWRKRHGEIGAACNERLWSDAMEFYSTSLPDGGHNTNKVVTGFWPLWANIVPDDRVGMLVERVKDPKSFWRHHPVPSLAADSPEYRPGGDYWLGSTWAPTNCATIKGFQRAGRFDVAREILTRHLQCMYEVFEQTGHIWENYCAERSAPGNWSGPDYSWSAVGPIALLLEVLVGLEPSALERSITWSPPPGKTVGAKRYPLGACTIDLLQERREGGDVVVVNTDLQFTLNVVRGEATKSVVCEGGRTEIPL